MDSKVQAASTARESLSERLKRLNDKFEPSRHHEGGSASKIQTQSIVHKCAQTRDLKPSIESSSQGIETGLLNISHRESDHSNQRENVRDGNEDTTEDEGESCNSPIINIKKRCSLMS